MNDIIDETEKEKFMAQVEELMNEITTPAICGCGTCEDALETALRLFKEASDNNCTLWALQICIAMGVVSEIITNAMELTEVNSIADAPKGKTIREVFEATPISIAKGARMEIKHMMVTAMRNERSPVLSAVVALYEDIADHAKGLGVEDKGYENTKDNLAERLFA